MSAPSDSTSVTHSIQKLLLIRARFLTRQLNFDIYGSAIRNAVAPDIGLAVLTHPNDRAVLGVELAYRVVYSVTAVLTESRDNLVL